MVPHETVCWSDVAYRVLFSPARPGHEGDEVNSSKDDGATPPGKGGGKSGERTEKNVGDALRAVYQDAVSENIPDEMLDLLKKLG